MQFTCISDFHKHKEDWIIMEKFTPRRLNKKIKISLKHLYVTFTIIYNIIKLIINTFEHFVKRMFFCVHVDGLKMILVS